MRNFIEPPTCDCAKCKSMCTRPCGLTPDEARAFIAAGYGNRLETRPVDWDNPDDELGLWPRLSYAPERYMCTFFTRYGRCGVHHMKPLEGRMAHHDEEIEGASGYDRQRDLLDTWKTTEAQTLIAEWYNNTL